MNNMVYVQWEWRTMSGILKLFNKSQKKYTIKRKNINIEFNCEEIGLAIE